MKAMKWTDEELGRCRVLLFRGRGVISSIIRWQTRSRYSHVAFLLPDGEVLESWQGAGVRVKRLEDREGVDAYAVRDMTPGQWRRALHFAGAQVGSGYDYLAIARFVSRRSMPLNGRWFCSELVFAALAAAEVRLLERVEAWGVSPGLLSLSPRLEPCAPTLFTL